MTAPILWAPGVFFFTFSLQENLHAHKILVLEGGGGLLGLGGGGSADFIFMGARIFWIFGNQQSPHHIIPDSRRGADSQIAREPVYEPHPAPDLL